MHDIWVEKYRPHHLADIAGQTSIVERLEAYAKAKSVPHLIFAGPAGTGKTTAALALARDLYGEQTWTQNFHELNVFVTAFDESELDFPCFFHEDDFRRVGNRQVEDAAVNLPN